jgi:hypothetical protein
MPVHKVSDGRMEYAKIHIDIRKRTATFDYPEAPVSAWGTFCSLFCMFLLTWLAMVILVMSVLGLNTAGNDKLTFMTIAVPPLLLAAYYYVRHRDDLSKLMAFHAKLLRFGRVDRMHIDSLRGREYVLPCFKNLMLDYRLQGDFAAQIKTIDIFPVYYGLRPNKEKPVTWQARFVFERKPKDGCMLLEFILGVLMADKERSTPGYSQPMKGRVKPRQKGSGLYPAGFAKQKLEKNRQKKYKRTRRKRKA